MTPGSLIDAQGLMAYLISSPSRVDELVRDPRGLAERVGADALVAVQLAAEQSTGLWFMAELVRTKWMTRLAWIAPATVQVLMADPEFRPVLDEFLSQPLNAPYELAEVGLKLTRFLAAHPVTSAAPVRELARFEVLLYSIARVESPEQEIRLAWFNAPVGAIRRRALAGGSAASATIEAAQEPHAYLFMRRDDGRVRLIRLSAAAASMIEKATGPGRAGPTGMVVPPAAIPVLRRLKID